MIGIDTNVLVRYLTQDDPRQAAAATRLVEQELGADRPGFVSAIVLAELCWVLRRLYRVETAELAGMLADLLSVPVFVFEARAAAQRALEQVRERGAEYPDALIHQLSLGAGCSVTYTFDRVAARTSGMSLLPS